MWYNKVIDEILIISKGATVMNQEYLLKKEVDWSALLRGISIPSAIQSIFYHPTAHHLKKGESRKVKILLNSLEFVVNLSNIKFDENKYKGHSEMLQIRYTDKSDLSKYFVKYFESSYLYLKNEKERSENKRKQCRLPDDLKEYIYIYATEEPDTFIFECVSCKELELERDVTQQLDEMELENLLNREDATATIQSIVKVSKVRHLDVTISNRLKKVYNYSCQVCGEKIGEKYSADFIHAHHIQPFSTSLNNNPDNIMILCPNHHGIVHVAKPTFDIEKKFFLYPNGLKEGLILNRHL